MKEEIGIKLGNLGSRNYGTCEVVGGVGWDLDINTNKWLGIGGMEVLIVASFLVVFWYFKMLHNFQKWFQLFIDQGHAVEKSM